MPDLPRLLLLGDSIRMSYQPHVADLLESRAQVVGPADNCQYSLFTLSSLDRWVGELGQPDLVHWNNGIHDAGHNPDRCPKQIPLDMYRGNLEIILRRLKGMTPHVVFATSTPVYPGRPIRDTEWSWRNEEIDEYNRVARELMEANQVPVNDLHALVWSDLDAYLAGDQLHLSEDGRKACARAAIAAVDPYLGSA